MTRHEDGKLADAIELIEAAYEYMLAYAAQGRDREAPAGADGLSIRKFLDDLEKGLKTINSALAEKIESLHLEPGALQALEQFRQRLTGDADAALEAVKVVQTVPSISSQLIDNLNASVHLRCLLTDMFIIDEALSIHQRQVAAD